MENRSEQKKVKKPFYKKVWFWIVVLLVIVGLNNRSSSEDEKNTDSKSNQEIEEVEVVNEFETDSVEETVTSTEKVVEKKEPEKTVTEYKAGTYIVGDKIPAGEYKIISDGGLGAYAEVASDSSGELESIIANEIVTTFSYITISDGQYFKLNGAKAIPIAEVTPYVVEDKKYGDGVYRVGIDIPAGEYEVIATDDLAAYVEVASASTWQLESIVTNEIIENNTFITVSDGQYLKLSGAEIILQ